MRVVAGSAFAAMRILLYIEGGENRPHLMAAEALIGTRDESPACRIACGKQRDVGCELMTARAMQDCLPLHFAKDYVDILLLVTATLRAGFAGRQESMQLFTVAGNALEIFQSARVGFEVNAVTCC